MYTVTGVEVFNKDSRLLTEEGAFRLELYDEESRSFNEETAYLDGEFYYLYRGNYDAKKNNPPGIYYDEAKDTYIKIDLKEEEYDQYRYFDKVGITDPSRLIDAIHKHELVIVAAPETDAVNIPDIKVSDNILKRLIKDVMKKKRINIDIYKDRFVDKNALFNFRQVLRGDSPMSMLLFDRGTDAFNLKYTITVEEAEPNDLIIGIPLKEPISMSSDDVYSLV